LDCGKKHREIFAIPGRKKKVVRELKAATEEINGQLADFFGL
jgi:hypothetical protein